MIRKFLITKKAFEKEQFILLIKPDTPENRFKYTF